MKLNENLKKTLKDFSKKHQITVRIEDNDGFFLLEGSGTINGKMYIYRENCFEVESSIEGFLSRCRYRYERAKADYANPQVSRA